MDIKLIKSEADYQEALKKLESIFDAPIGTSESDQADLTVRMSVICED